MKKNYSFASICVISAGIFFSCIITPQPRETSPNSGAPGFDVPEYVPPAVTPVASVPATSPSETIPWVSPPETIPEEVLPEVISQENPPGTIPWVSPPETIPEEVPPEVVTLAAAVSGWPIAEPESSAASLPPVGQGRVPVPEFIMGRGIVLPKEMAAFLLESNPGVEKAFIEELAYIYNEETAVEGVNSDVAFAQMCLETGFLHFGGLVTADMNNFCGLGATGPTERGLSFPNPRMGIRAHIQHLKAYATEEPLKQVLVDPRFHYVRRGSSPAIDGLAGTWAEDRAYAEKISNILERLYSFYYKY